MNIYKYILCDNLGAKKRKLYGNCESLEAASMAEVSKYLLERQHTGGQIRTTDRCTDR